MHWTRIDNAGKATYYGLCEKLGNRVDLLAILPPQISGRRQILASIVWGKEPSWGFRRTRGYRETGYGLHLGGTILVLWVGDKPQPKNASYSG